MVMKTKKKFNKGFTVVEIMIVVVIIAILSMISIVSYNNIAAKTNDAQVKADMDKIASALALYSADHKTPAGKAYYSGNGYDSELDFAASDGVVIDVVTNSDGYCIRGYSAKGTITNIDDAYERGSVIEICNTLGPSVEAGGTLAWKQISAGGYFTCAVASNNKAYCWGYNGSGRLGDNTSSDRWVPTPVYTGVALSGLDIKFVAAGMWHHACVIASNDNAYCWGSNDYAELGINTTGAGTGSLQALAVDKTSANYYGQPNGLLNKTVKSIDGGFYHNCVVTNEDSKIYCWGQDWTGMLGDGGVIRAEYVPTAVDTSGVLSGKTIKAFASGEYHTCAIASDNLVYCWGWDDHGQLGDNQSGDGIYAVSPRAINMTNGQSALYGKTVKAIDAGERHTCVIANEDNWVYCWGHNDYGQAGDGTEGDDRLVATRMVDGNGVLNGKTIKSISLGQNHTCVIASDDKAYCWGNGKEGQLGYGPGGCSEYPVPVNTTNLPGNGTVKAITAGSDHTCAIASNDQIYCWGLNDEGELGNNSTVSSNIPVAVSTVQP